MKQIAIRGKLLRVGLLPTTGERGLVLEDQGEFVELSGLTADELNQLSEYVGRQLSGYVGRTLEITVAVKNEA